MGLKAWLMDDSDADMREPHERNPPEFVDEEFLSKHKILVWQIDAEDYENDETYKKIRSEREYKFGDVITIAKDKLPNYEEKLKGFYKEHMHMDEEVRFCLEGSGFFDFRDAKDRWVRIHFNKGVFLVLPAGCYHRFTLDSENYIKCKRLYSEMSEWTPFYRPADDHPSRAAYLSSTQHLRE